MIESPNLARTLEARIAYEAEALVLKSCRQWWHSVADRDPEGLSAVWASHSKALGGALGRMAMDGLCNMIDGLGQCAHCPLKFLQHSDEQLGEHECLVMTMIAGIQNGDDDTTWNAAERMTCPMRAGELIGAAGGYAIPLKAGGLQLLPITFKSDQRSDTSTSVKTMPSASKLLH